ncbi:MAG TPA: ArsA family ATPase [Terriglobales bacterium]|nr:ArsA family ATPase [Terriglobales bacterium]
MGSYNSGVKRLYLFVGKGGVGKTTVSSAFAVRSALHDGKGRVLLISTDPAHSLADVLQTRLRDQPKKIKLPGPGSLEVWQINSEKLFRSFLQQHKDDILDLIDKGSLFSREDVEPLLDTSLPGMAEMAALLAIRDAIASAKYSRIVVDTAPFGHTLRLFSLPEQFVRFLTFLELAASRDQVVAAHFGGRSLPEQSELLDHFRGMVTDIQEALTGNAEVCLVTTAEQFSLQESVRCTNTLKDQSSPIPIASIVLNRVVLTKSGCAQCNRVYGEGRRAQTFLRKHFPGVPIRVGDDPGGPILGTERLAAFGEHVFGGQRLKYTLQPPRGQPVPLERTHWPIVGGKLALVVGKGGVGKTTTSAALAFETRHRSNRTVEICSVDPAPSLDDVFETQVGPASQPVFGDSKLRASELDAIALFRVWIRDLQSTIADLTSSEVSGIHVDLSFERQLLSELLEIVPPGVDELLAIFRIFDLVESEKTKIVVDMAPTGHALELLRMPERMVVWSRLLLKTLAAHRTLAFARDAAAKIAEISVRSRELAALLKDSESAEVDVVMLPEPLPDRETERLLAELKTGNLLVRRIFVNRVRMGHKKCRRCSRAQQWQQASLATMKRRQPGMELLVIRNFPHEIAGKAALQSFTGELWRVK